MTGATRCPRFAATSPIAPWSCRPKPARDAATPGPPPDASAAARARRLDALRARLAVDGAPVCCGAGAGNPGRTRTGARAPSRRPRTTSDTPYTEPAPWQRLPSAPLHRAGPLPGAPPRPPWITIAPPEATTSAGAVGHDRAVGWITSRAPLKPWGRRACRGGARWWRRGSLSDRTWAAGRRGELSRHGLQLAEGTRRAPTQRASRAQIRCGGGRRDDGEERVREAQQALRHGKALANPVHGLAPVVVRG